MKHYQKMLDVLDGVTETLDMEMRANGWRYILYATNSTAPSEAEEATWVQYSNASNLDDVLLAEGLSRAVQTRMPEEPA